MNRRDMLIAMGLMAGTSPLFAGPAIPGNAAEGLAIFDVKKFGAVGDGRTLDTVAINKAVDACATAGGGTVYLSPGVYLSGTVVLKSNVIFFLEAGATLLGSTNLSDYSSLPGPPVNGDANQRHLICARDAHNIGLAGQGTIDGQGQAYWMENHRQTPPPEDGWRDVVAFNWSHRRRPSPMLEFYNCKRLRIQDIHITNSPGWTLRPIHCDNVFIRGISIKNPVYGPNTDGIDLTCCQNVFISDCLIDTGDDAICLKSENPYGEPLRVSRNITVVNCILSGCCNGFKIGTATFGGFENIVFSNSVIFNDDVPLNSRIIAGLAIEMVDGGAIDGVLVSNIRMQRVRTPVFVRLGNRRPNSNGSPGTLRGLMIENIHAAGSILTSSITGLPGFNVGDVTLSNIRIESDENGKAEWANREIPEHEKSYPEARQFGRLPGYGLYCRHVDGLRLGNIEFRAGPSEARPAFVCDDVQNLDVDTISGTAIKGTQPFIKLIRAKRAFIRGCTAPTGIKTFLQAEGAETESIVLNGNNLLGAERPVYIDGNVSSTAVTASGNILSS